jgi:type IV secretion system protein VirD4
MKRVLVGCGALLVVGALPWLSSGAPAGIQREASHLQNRALALEHWTWVALAWPAENVTRAHLGGERGRATSQKGAAVPALAAEGTIGWDAWLAMPTERRYQALHQPTAHAEAVQTLVWVEVAALPLLALLALWRPLVGRRLGRLAPSTARGSARWLRGAELRALRPRPVEAGLVLGRAGRRLVVLPEAEVYQNVLVVGPPGAGKSASLFIPPLLEERGRRSLVIVDPKSELIARTYARVARLHDAAILNFLDPAVSIGYNPLTMVTDALSAGFFADCWVKNTGTSSEHFWDDTARQLIAAAALHLVAVLGREGATLNELALFLTYQDPARVTGAFETSPSAEARRLGAQFLKSMSENHRLVGSVFTGLPLRFSLLNDARVQAVTGTHELDLSRLADPGHPPLALYLALDHTMAHLLTPLSACFFTHLFTRLMTIAYAQPDKELPRPVLCLLDEFGNVGQIPNMARWLATMRSARMGCVLAVQDLAQLAATYGTDQRQVITTSCTTTIGLAGMMGADARWFSEQTGTATVITRSAGTQRRRGEALPQSGTVGLSEGSRPLLTPGEVTRMARDALLVLAGNRQPALLRQRRWYADRRLRQLALQPLANRAPTPPGGPRRASPLPAPEQVTAGSDLEQAWWQEQAPGESPQGQVFMVAPEVAEVAGPLVAAPPPPAVAVPRRRTRRVVAAAGAVLTEAQAASED